LALPNVLIHATSYRTVTVSSLQIVSYTVALTVCESDCKHTDQEDFPFLVLENVHECAEWVAGLSCMMTVFHFQPVLGACP
jgi:hypothetical protein